MLAQPLHVGDEMPSGVVAQLGMRCGFSAAALIEQDDPIGGRVMQAAQKRRRATAWTAMQHYRRLALRVATFLEIELVHIRYAQPSGSIWLDVRERQNKGSHEISSQHL